MNDVETGLVSQEELLALVEREEIVRLSFRSSHLGTPFTLSGRLEERIEKGTYLRTSKNGFVHIKNPNCFTVEVIQGEEREVIKQLLKPKINFFRKLGINLG